MCHAPPVSRSSRPRLLDAAYISRFPPPLPLNRAVSDRWSVLLHCRFYPTAAAQVLHLHRHSTLMQM
eukprot:1120935-Prorocentrum_minimum.AAC.1